MRNIARIRTTVAIKEGAETFRPPGGGAAPGRARREPRAKVGAAYEKTPGSCQHGQERITPHDSQAELRRELLRSCACRTFVFQFTVMARRAVPAAPKRGKGGRGRGGGIWRPYRVPPKRAPSLAAVKHAQALGEERARGEFLPAATAVVTGWPDEMRRDFFACKTPVEYRLWSEKWGEQLSGRPAQQQRAMATPARPIHARPFQRQDSNLRAARFS
jgi:hypothetical protein